MEPICAPATALFPSAVAIVRVSGDHLSQSLAPLLRLPPPRIASLRWLRWKGYLERALVLFFPAPKSYTGEELVEFQLHGNPLLVRRFMECLNELGIRLAEPGEFTRRALMNGKQGLIEAEALRDLINSHTDQQLRQAQARAGGIPAWIQEAKRVLTPWMARGEAAMDYGEEEGIGLQVENLKVDLIKLKDQFHVERHKSEAARWLRDGIRIALVGRPNAGKSTLFNTLAGEDRAIVTDIPGTTRDVLEVETEWRGLPLRLFDTAGLRETDDLIEGLGVARVRGILEFVDLILHLIPSQDEGPDPKILGMLEAYASKVLPVRSQSDQGSAEGLVISALKGELDGLERALKSRFLGDQAPEQVLGALATTRQRNLLDELLLQVELLVQLESNCPPELIASSLQGAWGLLMRLTGEDRAESALDQVFSGFCLGK
jgi:tRNA modification GTPase